MHEQAIAQEIIAKAKEQEMKSGRLKSITITVGDVGHLPADEMKEVLKNMVPEWEVIVNRQKAKVACDCGFVGEPEILEKGHDHNVFRCPKCKSMMPKILDGDRIILESVELA